MLVRHPRPRLVHWRTSGVLAARQHNQAPVDAARPLNRTQADRYNSNLSSLQLAIFGRDLVTVWSSYAALREENNLHRIGLRQCQAISSYVVSLLDRPLQPNSDAQAQIEQFAITAASQGASAGLVSCMKQLIRRKKFQRVIDLYTVYSQDLSNQQSLLTSRKPETVSGPEDSIELDPFATYPRAAAVTSSTDPATSDILICVLIASAFLKSFRDLLPALVSVREKPSPQRMWEILRETTEDDEGLDSSQIHSTIRLYLRDLLLARLISSPVTMEKHIQNLVKSRNFKSLHQTWAAFIACFGDPEGWLAPVPSDSRPIAFPAKSWAVFLLAFARLKRKDCALEVWSAALDQGIKPTAEMWNALLQISCEDGKLDEVTTVWNRLRQQGVALSIPSFIALSEALWKGRKPEKAVALYQHVLKNHSGPREDLIDLSNALLRRQFQRANPVAALGQMKEMALNGPAPTKESFNLLLKYRQKTGDLQGLVATLEEMSSKGVLPDIASFTIVLDAFLQSGLSEPIRTLMDLMTTLDVEPNTATVTTIMQHVLRKGDRASLRVASDLLLQMELDPNPKVRPNEITYTQLMDAIYSCGEISGQEAEATVEEVWLRLLRSGAKPSRVTFEVLIKAAFRTQNADLAMKYFHQQRNRRMRFTGNVFEILLRNLIFLKRYELAEDVIEEVKIQGEVIQPELAKYINQVRGVHSSG